MNWITGASAGIIKTLKFYFASGTALDLIEGGYAGISETLRFI